MKEIKQEGRKEEKIGKWKRLKGSTGKIRGKRERKESVWKKRTCKKWKRNEQTKLGKKLKTQFP